jgi:hypothetical protein
MKKLNYLLQIALALPMMFPCSRCEADAQEKQVKNNVSNQKITLSFKKEAAVDKAVSTVSHDFGVVDGLDTKMMWAEAEAKEALKGTEDYLVGKKHTFLLYNLGNRPITIAAAVPDILCQPAVEARVWRSNKFLLFPQTILPKEKIDVVIGFDYSNVSAGAFHGSVKFLEAGSSAVVAQIKMTADVKGGVTFSQPLIDFGDVKTNSGASKKANLTIDRRMYSHLLPGDRLILECMDKSISVVFAGKSIRDDYALSGNTLIIKKDLQSNVKCSFHITLQKGIALGMFRRHIRLYAESAPNLLILNAVTLPVRGNVVKNKRL